MPSEQYQFGRFIGITCHNSRSERANLAAGSGQLNKIFEPIYRPTAAKGLILFRKDDCDEDLIISSGSLFQMSGAADQKVRVPMMVLVTRTSSQRELSVTSTFRSERLMV